MEELDDKAFEKLLGKRIKELRKEKGFTQAELAARCNLEKSAIQRIERGFNSTLKTLRLIARAFEISLSRLFDLK